MNADDKKKCHEIIHTASLAAGAIGGGLAQLPGSDTVPITAIQIGMIISLGTVFRREITETSARSILGGALSAASYVALSAVGGRTLSQFLVGWIPGLGNLINATTAAGITEGLGWIVANNFAEEASHSKEESDDDSDSEE